MKVVVLGGSGLIGKNVVRKLREKGHEVLAASPSLGVNALTGEGLSEALKGGEVVVDVTNSPSFEDQAVLTFFETSTRNLLAAEKEAGVKHHVALSVVGADRNPESGYLRAKVAQERLIEAGPIPSTILRATQFFEFLGTIADGSTEGTTVRLPAALMQPVAAEDVARELVEIATGAPMRGTVELAGPEAKPMAELIGNLLKNQNDGRSVTAEQGLRYFGAEVDDRSLMPGEEPRLGRISFEGWLASVE